MQKSEEVEHLMVEALNANPNHQKLKALWTGSWRDADSNKMIGEDAIVIDIDIFNKTLQNKSISINNINIVDLDSLEQMVKQCGGSFQLTDDLYDAIKTAEVFSAQSKSGIKQNIYNKNNDLYKIALQDLSDNHQFQLLQQLREWDSSELWHSRGRRNKHGTKGNKIQDTNFFKTNPKSPTLNAMANLALSHDIGKLDIFRTKEYQLYVTEDGFITLNQYLEKTNKFWQFTNNIDYRIDFISKKRAISLRAGTGKLAT